MIEGLSPATVELRNLVKRFGKDVYAVNNIDITIEKGELLTLLGPSGCGKTTALRLIAGLEQPTQGQIFLDDQDVARLPAYLRDVTMVFQSYALFPHMSVFDNVAYGLRVARRPKDETAQRVAEALAMVGLADLGHRAPNQLSGGQQQRVALARALVIRPRVLLFDEPLSNLDAKLRKRVREDIRSLQQRLGITSVYVTHDQEEALAISDRVVVMRDGKIEQVGSPHQLYTRPATRFVADFIGSANFLPGHFDGAEVDLFGYRWPHEQDVAHGAVTVMMRPEAVEFALDGEAGFEAMVRSTAYLGAVTEYVFEVAGHEVFANLTGTGMSEARPGDLVRLRLKPAAVSLLPVT
jgi:iron(III) transport system ATP-binding protein